MSPENDSERARIAREKYANLTQWEEQRPGILEDFKAVLGFRREHALLSSHGGFRELNIMITASATLKKVLAAELFPDETTPALFKAWNVSDQHTEVNDLVRATDPDLATKARISGEVVILKDDTELFLCDPIVIRQNTIKLCTEKNYLEVANILLNKGYIPVDAEFRILPIL